MSQIFSLVWNPGEPRALSRRLTCGVCGAMTIQQVEDPEDAAIRQLAELDRTAALRRLRRNQNRWRTRVR